MDFMALLKSAIDSLVKSISALGFSCFLEKIWRFLFFHKFHIPIVNHCSASSLEVSFVNFLIRST
ncbi:hypothetical protein Sjap_016856 [Stephania japonica]|uniref:Uncharacterized protein n=1 Tax=Stephania japonica TaxID=461633 RepID=A0AAP0I550_9MAGN